MFEQGGMLKMQAANGQNQTTNFYHIQESDNYSHEAELENLINNISKLDGLKKRLNFMLREIDLCINKS